MSAGAAPEAAAGAAVGAAGLADAAGVAAAVAAGVAGVAGVGVAAALALAAAAAFNRSMMLCAGEGSVAQRSRLNDKGSTTGVFIDFEIVTPQITTGKRLQNFSVS